MCLPGVHLHLKHFSLTVVCDLGPADERGASCAEDEDDSEERFDSQVSVGHE